MPRELDHSISPNTSNIASGSIFRSGFFIQGDIWRREVNLIALPIIAIDVHGESGRSIVAVHLPTPGDRPMLPLAVGNALQLVFQHPYLHKGCYFHYSQALMSHIKELGLMKEYNKNFVFNEYIRKLKVLAMVPFYSLAGCLKHLQDFR